MFRSGKKHPQRRFRFETLETRRLMAADVSLSDGTLVINGSDEADEVVVREDDGQIIVSQASIDSQSFLKGQVEMIRFRGRDGDDSFTNQTNIRSSATGGNGNDMLVGGGGNDYLSGGAGEDVLVGSEGKDYLRGGSGDDFLLGGRGDDTIHAGSGNDQVFGEEGADRLYGATGNDYLFGDQDSDRIYGGSGNDLLAGGDGRDRLSGGNGNDQLFGGKGVDWLFGNAGRDSLISGDGWSYLSGGAGRDRFARSGPNAPPTDGLSLQELAPVVDAAVEHWNEAGLASLPEGNLQYRIADLPGNTLGWTIRRNDGSAVIWIDKDAAGEGWFVDSTPLSNEEFSAVTEILHIGTKVSSQEKMDLLTVVSHEIGHAAGLEESSSLNVMSSQLVSGLRLLADPATANAARMSARGPVVHAMLSGYSGFPGPFQLAPVSPNPSGIPSYRGVPSYYVPSYLPYGPTLNSGTASLFFNAPADYSNLYSGLSGLSTMGLRSYFGQGQGFRAANQISQALPQVWGMANPRNYLPTYGYGGGSSPYGPSGVFGFAG